MIDGDNVMQICLSVDGIFLLSSFFYEYVQLSKCSAGFISGRQGDIMVSLAVGDTGYQIVKM